MSLLGIDWGEKRVGVSLSEDGVLAFPFQVLENNNAIHNLGKIIKEKKIEKIILGWPIGLSGEETQKTKEVEVFFQALSLLNIPIEKVDERYSTKMVPREGHGVDMKDAVSAQILLQEYLDSQ